MRILVTVVLSLSMAQGCASAMPEPRLDSEKLEFFRGGHDGLTNRLFDAVIGGEANWTRCEQGCRRVIVHGVRPTDRETFTYQVDVGPEQATGAASDIVLRGTCREDEIQQCARAIRGQIASTVSPAD